MNSGVLKSQKNFKTFPLGSSSRLDGGYEWNSETWSLIIDHRSVARALASRVPRAASILHTGAPCMVIDDRLSVFGRPICISSH